MRYCHGMADEPLLSNNLKDLLEKARAELMAMPANEIVNRTITRDRVLTLTKVMHASWKKYQHVLPMQLHPEVAKLRQDQILGLRGRARVFYAADLSSESKTEDTVNNEIAALAAVVAGHDRKLFKWAKPLFEDDPVKAATLTDIARGRGKTDDANDVLRLSMMFRQNWGMAKGKTEVDEKLLDEAEAAAHALLELLASDAANPAKGLAARAYTAWYRDYVQLRRLGLYLFGDLPDARQLFPGVSSGNSRRAPVVPEPVVKIEDLDDDEPPADEQNADEQEQADLQEQADQQEQVDLQEQEPLEDEEGEEDEEDENQP